MKINKIASSLLFFLSITTFAFGQKYANGLVDKVIALVGNEMIQLSAIEEEVQMQIMQGIITDKNLRKRVREAQRAVDGARIAAQGGAADEAGGDGDVD